MTPVPVPERFADAARLLADARRSGVKIAALPAGLAPQTQGEAWAIQREVLRQTGSAAGGFKAAAPPNVPAFGAIMPAPGLHDSPARIGVPPGGRMGIEGEIAFRMARDLRPRGGNAQYSRAEVLDAVAGAFAAIELVESRFADPASVPQLHSIADNFANAGFVAGSGVAGWRDMDLASLRVRLEIGGVMVKDKVGGNPAGDPVLPLVWLANYLPSVGLWLEAGQVVTAGSYTGLDFAAPGQRAVVRFEGIGEASVEIA